MNELTLVIISIVIAGVSLIIGGCGLTITLIQKRKIDTLLNGVTNTNLVQLVEQFTTLLKKADNDILMMNNEFTAVRNESKGFFRKVGLVRFSAFKDVGGDQSFALALLDEENNGFIISSMHGRDVSRTYAKRIENGTSVQHTLTEEEQSALHEAAHT